MRTLLAVIVALMMFLPVSALAQNGPSTDKIQSHPLIASSIVGSTDLKTKDIQYKFNAPVSYYGLGYGGMVHLQDQTDMQFVQYPGLPRVPVKTKVIELPGDFRIKDVTQTHGTENVVYLPGPLETSPALTAIGRTGAVPDFQLKSYYNGQSFPADWFTYALHRGLNGNSEDTVFVDLYMFPAIYDGAAHKLTYTDSMDVTIHYTTVNALMAPRAVSYKMVIIGPEEFRAPLQILSAHKNMTGLNSIFVSLPEIYDSKFFPTQGRDAQEQIKYFIKNAVESWGIKYALIGGDVDEVPTRHVKVLDTFDDSGSMLMDGMWVPSDIYYGDIYDSSKSFSSWDENSNGIFGEWTGPIFNGMTDNPDMYEDVYVGRLPASNLPQMQDLVQKIRNYENQTDWSWFLNAALSGVDTWPWPEDNSGVAESEYGLDQTGITLASKGFALHKFYQTKGTLSPQAINNALNQGMGVSILSGHGLNVGWGNETVLYYTVFDMPGISNGIKLPVGSQSACDTGAYDNEDTSYFPYPPWDPYTEDAMSEQFLLQNGGGYIADSGASRVAFGNYGTGWVNCCIGLLENTMYKALVNGQLTPSRMLSKGRDDYISAMGLDSVTDYKHMMEYNLMGDPSVAIGGVGFSVKALSNDTLVAPDQTTYLNFSVKDTGVWSVSPILMTDWNGSVVASVSPPTLTLSPGEEKIVTVEVTANHDAVAGTIVPVKLLAWSTANDRTLSASANVTIARVYGMELTSDHWTDSAQPGGSVSFVLTAINRGNAPDGADFAFTYAPSGWGTRFSFVHVDMPVFGNGETTVSVDIPVQVLPGSYWFNVSATLSGAPIVRNKTLWVNVLARHEIAMSCDPCSASVDPGKPVQIPLNLTNKGNVLENITVNGTLPAGWSLDAGTLPYIVAPFQFSKFNATITPPERILAGTYTITVMANILQQTVEVVVTVTINRVHGIKFTVDAPELTVDGGKDAIFTSSVVNTGNGPETVRIENMSQPIGWTAQGEMTELTVQGYDTSTLKLYVTTKYETLAGSYGVTMRASSMNVTGLTDQVALKVHIAERIMAQASLKNQTASALPGKSVSNSVHFEDQGNVNETISLALSTNNDLVFKALGSSVTVQPQSSADTGFTLTVSDGALAGSHDYTVQVRRDKGPTIYLNGTMTVVQVYKLDIQTEPSSYVVTSGGKLVRKVLVTNRGNGQDTFTLQVEGMQRSWASAALGPIVLGPGQSKEVAITISPPNGVAPDKHQLSVKATSTSGLSKTALVEYRVKDKGGTSTASSNLWLLVLLLVAVAIGFVVGRAVLKERKEVRRQW